MKIVIDVPDVLFEALRNSSHVYLTMGGRGNGKTLISTILVAVANGTPLPKGHGRLIDADVLESILKNKAFDKARSAKFYEIVWAHKQLLNAPTILEADKEVENADSY